jgi:hypothetical protein
MAIICASNIQTCHPAALWAELFPGQDGASRPGLRTFQTAFRTPDATSEGEEALHLTLRTRPPPVGRVHDWHAWRSGGLWRNGPRAPLRASPGRHGSFPAAQPLPGGFSVAIFITLGVVALGIAGFFLLAGFASSPLASWGNKLPGDCPRCGQARLRSDTVAGGTNRTVRYAPCGIVTLCETPGCDFAAAHVTRASGPTSAE